MPLISQMSESKFLKRADVGAGKLLTIESCEQQNVARADDAPEMKWCLHFHEEKKPLVLNRINAELIGMITGQQNSDNWTGHKVVLYDDPTISFGGKLVGGIRIRAPKNKPATAGKPVPALPITDGPKPGDPDWDDGEDDSNSIPF